MKKLNKVISCFVVGSVLLSPVSTFALTKTETIYTNLSATGKVSKSVVNNHLTDLVSGDVSDSTYLSEILNINGDEDFKLEGNNLTWKSTGKDIFYSGKTEEETPIGVKATYYLDGKEVKAKSIVGKSGSVRIVYSFTNSSYNSKENLYTPFVVTMATMISNKINSNINVVNGKSVNTGTKNMVCGVATPGLYNDLKINELKGLDSITLSYDTTSFSMSDVYLVATPKVLEEADLDVFDKMDTLSSSINTIQTNMDKIESGAKELNEGSKKLLDGSKQLKEAVDSSIASTKADTSSALDANTIFLIKQQAISGATLSNEQLAYIGNSAVSALQGNSTYTNLKNGISTLEANGINDSLINACSTSPVTSGYESICSTNASYIQQYSTYKQMIELMEGTAKNTAMATAQQVASQTAGTVAETVAPNVANSVKKAATDKTVASLNVLSENLGTLVNGIETLDNGTSTLSNGVSELNKQGINTLTNYTNTFSGYSKKLERLVNLSKNYKGYGSNNSDETIFIYKMKSVK